MPTKLIIINVLTFIALFLISNSTLIAAENNRPFWTEKSSYIEGEYLYVVGIATGKGSEEESRKLAFENGVTEILNFAQLSNLGQIVIETQMTYTEETNNGNITVFRLLKVKYDDIEKLITERALKAKENNTRFIKNQEKDIQEKKETLSIIERNNEEISKLELRRREISSQIQTNTRNAINTVKRGMTESQVIELFGSPLVPRTDCGTPSFLNYGEVWIMFESGLAKWFIPIEKYNGPCGAYSPYFDTVRRLGD